MPEGDDIMSTDLDEILGRAASVRADALNVYLTTEEALKLSQ
jgi:hypothetical protein